MYQSILYDFKEYKYYLKDDKKGVIDFQYTPTYYQRLGEHEEGALPILTGGWAKPCKLQKDNPNILEKDINKELVLLRDYYYKEDDSIPSWHNVVFLDIETEMGGALTSEYIKQSPMPITSIALLDKTTKTEICFIVDKNIQEINANGRHVIPCASEKELILKFLDKWEELEPTIVVTWNGAFFDMPWIYYRFCKIVGENQTLRLSPIRKINVQDWDEANPIRIGLVNHLDYMLLHKKYIMKEEPSYKLNDIGLKYAKMGKLEYDGNLNNLFKLDPNKYVDYNLRDVEIIDKIDENLKFIDLTVMISHICNIPYESIYHSTVLGEGAMLKHLKRLGIVSPNKPTTYNPSLRNNSTKLAEAEYKAGNITKEQFLELKLKATYAGGYVKDPIPGIYEYLFDIDFTSLYPSIIKGLNIGIETLMGRIYTENNYEQSYSIEKLKEMPKTNVLKIEKLNMNTYRLQETEITVGKLIKFIEDNKWSVAASGAFFRTDKRSAHSEVLEGWFNKREHYRGLKKTAGKAKDWVKYSLYDTYQLAFKILQNGSYGTYAIHSWRYSDGNLICSAAITNSGQRLTKSSIVYTNDLISNKILKMNKEQLQEYFNI